MIKILVVDDSKTMRDIISQVLTRAGYEITTANDGRAALQVAKDGNFQMVLTDVYMPEKNGPSLVASLRRLPGYAETPVIMITTESADFMKKKCRDLGANAWLTKPIDATRLLTAVSTLSENHGLA